MPRLPSEILGLRKQGISDEECLDFDLAFVYFDGWIEAKQNERIRRKPDKDDGKVAYPKYESLDAILALYDTKVMPGQMVAEIDSTRREVDALIDEIVTSSEPMF
jgi:hypothetical protein